MYYSLIENKILFKEINYHPIFSYGLNIVRLISNNYIIYVAREFDIEIVKEYHNNVFYINGDEKFLGDKIELDRPLLNEDHIRGCFDKLYEFKIHDNFDFIAAKSLISSDFCKSRPEKLFKKFEVIKINNPSKIKLLFTAPYIFFNNDLKEKINTSYEVTYAYQASKEVIKNLILDQEILFTSTCPTYLIDGELLKNSNIHTIATPSTGTTHIDMSFMKRNNIKVVSIKNSNVIDKIYASSEFSFTLLLAMINKLHIVVDNARVGGWRENESKFRSQEINEMKIGLIGYGRIGKKMAKYAHAFGMDVHVFDPYVKVEENWINVHSSKENLLKCCDIISLHYHLNEKTIQSFSAIDFKNMRNGAYFLNTARAELVDEKAMLFNLKNHKLKAAAVDVISNEHIYNKWNHPVIKYARENKNLIVSNHVAGLTDQSETKAAFDIFKQLENEF
jgi:phosphoglycerate dehydrogenase-like enzyme